METDESESKNDQLQAAGMVARVANLTDVRLGSVSAELLAPLAEVTSSVCTLEVSSTSESVLREPENELEVDFAARIMLTKGEEASKDGNRFLEIRVQLVLTYQLASVPPEDERGRFFRAFADVNGPYNAWPYLRELVQSLVGRMGLPPLVLPVFRIPIDNQGSRAAPKLRVVGG